MMMARLKLKNSDGLEEVKIIEDMVKFRTGDTANINQLNYDNPIAGTVYGTLLNYKGALEAMGEKLNAPPHNKQPKAPILYIKPHNTFSSPFSTIPLPHHLPVVEVGASLGIVIKKTATRVSEAEAWNYIEGYTIVNDITEPHESVYRPSVRYKARDKFCPIGPWIVSSASVSDPNSLGIRVFVNGELRQENNTQNLVRSIPKLLHEVTDFMTLFPGDLLFVGVPENPPLVRPGDHIRIEIDEIGSLENNMAEDKERPLEEML